MEISVPLFLIESDYSIFVHKFMSRVLNAYTLPNCVNISLQVLIVVHDRKGFKEIIEWFRSDYQVFSFDGSTLVMLQHVLTIKN
jgi:hypothetical protein